MDKPTPIKQEPVSLPKQEPVKTEEHKEPIQNNEKNIKINNSDSKEKYKKLKRKYAQLMQEHSKILNEFEVYVEEMNKLCEERKFLRNKINCILKNQGYNVTLSDKTAKSEGN